MPPQLQTVKKVGNLTITELHGSRNGDDRDKAKDGAAVVFAPDDLLRSVRSLL